MIYSFEKVQCLTVKKESSPLIQIYDSNYYWDWNAVSTGWRIGYKINGIVYNRNGSDWENSNQSTYTFDANNNLTGVLSQSWDNGVWVNSDQENYTYDAGNFSKSYSYKEWDNAGNVIIDDDNTQFYLYGSWSN